MKMGEPVRYASLIQLHDDPLVFCSPSGQNLAFCVQKSAEIAAGRLFHVLIVPYWYLSYLIDELVELSRKTAALHPNGRLVIMCPSSSDVELARSRGLEALHTHQNAFIDDTIYYPAPEAKIFDAIHVANPEPFKRHSLAWGVRRIAVVGYDMSNDQSRTTWPELSGYQDLAFTNLQPNGRFRWMPGAEVRALCNRSHVGLILSAAEGANFASGEYRFCGLPVISTESRGGRSFFLDPHASFIVAAQSCDVEEMVQRVIKDGSDPQSIRARAMALAIEHRARLLDWMGQVSGVNMRARADGRAWLPTFCDKLRRYRSISLDGSGAERIL